MRDATRNEDTRRGKPYRSPEIRTWGSVVDLTAQGNTRPGEDILGGSMIAPPDDSEDDG